MNAWFRFYREVLHDPKVQLLDPILFKFWVSCLCIASEHEGFLPTVQEIAFTVRLPQETTSEFIEVLVAERLLDRKKNSLKPHNWDGRQFVSDNSSTRVERYRDKRRVSGLPILSDYTKFKPQLVTRDGEQCIYCLAGVRLVVDHMVPIIQGGTDDIDNLALACKGCNAGKAGRTPFQAGMKIKIQSAENALTRYCNRDNAVTVTPPDSDTEQTQKQIQKREEKPLSASADFEAFWISSTRRGSKKDALSIWKQIPALDRPAVLIGMAAWQKSEQWRDETKQPHIFRWLKRRGWEEIVPNSKRNGSVGSDEQARKQFEEIYGRPPVS